jgi:hypothetical protein
MKKKINVVVHDPVEVSNGVYKTEITSPNLDGALSFIHGANNRDQTLGAIENSLVDDLTELTETLKGFVRKK